MRANPKIRPRPLTDDELWDRSNEIYDSFANYLVFCKECGHLEKSNMYVMSAEAFRDRMIAAGRVCPKCRESAWLLGYPANSCTGFVEF